MDLVFSRTLVVLFSLVVISCNRKPEIEKQPDLKLEGPLELSVPVEGMVQEYTLRTTGSWEIIRKSSETWADIKPSRGKNDGEFSITFTENKSVNSRSMRFSVLLDGKESTTKISVIQEGASLAVWDETKQDKQLLTIQLGIPSYSGTAMMYRRGNTPVMKINLAEPVIVAMADKPQPWGYFNFPSIYKGITENTLVCGWSMANDDAGSYGKGGGDRRFSSDGGKTWYAASKTVRGGGLLLPGGEMISVNTPVALDINEIDLPEPIKIVQDGSAYNRKFTLYRHDELPDVLQGVYINYWDKSGAYSLQHALLEDENLVRYADGDLFPIVWWGDMKVLSDGSIVIVPYPVFYENEDGNVDASGVSLYRSVNQGMTWTVRGVVPYKPDSQWDPNGIRRNSFGWTEPAFEILSDGTYLLVLRTADGYGDSPMYISRSSDQGATWSTPKPFTPAGVRPKMLQLENGVLVLASGRPGVQLRFSFDGKGEEWTDPFELIPYNKGESSTMATCGYPRLLATGPDSFLVVYSDFRYLNENNEERKAIKVREIKVEKLSQ
jgi:hypothetical protein